MRLLKLALCAGAALAAVSGTAWAEDQPAAPTPPPFPLGMDGPIAINPTPLVVKTGLPFLNSVTINGAVTGMGLWQDNPVGKDQHARFDLTNGQVFISKSDGLVQFFVDVGAYSFPTLGTPYTPASKAVDANFGAIPMAYLKLQPTSDFSIEAGKLPTLFGAEYNFTFENMNIERGLLWNQENLVNRGVQANYTKGPLAFAVSFNDGFYSNNLSWITGSAAWTINSTNTLTFVGGGNIRKTDTTNSATPVFQNNSQIYNLIYTHTQGPWTITPYIQYTEVPALPQLGTGFASTFGGALFVDYAVPSDAKLGGVPLGGLSLPVRFEYISTRGTLAANSANLLYGPGSNAWSLTFSPTYQYKVYFIRAEVSYVDASSTTPGSVFGANGDGQSQTRGLIEIGTVF